MYRDYQQFFDTEIKSKGLNGTFDEYFNQLMGESLGAAMHPLIHVGYAMEFENPMLLSEGLAFACVDPLLDTSRMLSDDDANPANPDTTVFDLIEELRKIDLPEVIKQNWCFAKRLECMLQNHWMVFKNLISR